MNQTVTLIIRAVIVFSAILSSLVIESSIAVSSYVLVLLVFIANAQLRRILLKGNGQLVSLFVDLVLVHILQIMGGGINFILFSITVIDALTGYHVQGYLVTTIAMVLLGYHLKGLDPIYAIYAGAFHLVLIMLVIQIREHVKKADEIEWLYDQNRRYSYQLEKAKTGLEAYAERVGKLTQDEERARISLEIHDTVGHKLTGTLMQLEAGLLMLTRDLDRGRKTLAAVCDNLRDSIEILRQTVRWWVEL